MLPGPGCVAKGLLNCPLFFFCSASLISTILSASSSVSSNLQLITSRVFFLFQLLYFSALFGSYISNYVKYF